jgi:hypothetical protein
MRLDRMMIVIASFPLNTIGEKQKARRDVQELTMAHQ